MLLGRHVWRQLTLCDEVRSKAVLRRDQYSSSPSNVREQAYSAVLGLTQLESYPDLGRAAWQKGLPLEIQLAIPNIKSL